MKKQEKKNLGYRWWLWWVGQAVVCLAASLLVALCYYLGGTVHSILAWGIYPVFSAVTACVCTTHGLNNYLAWILPPLAVLPANAIVWGYLPSPGPVFLCALICIFGAAAGQVLKTQKH